jgi:hypothetical protein
MKPLPVALVGAFLWTLSMSAQRPDASPRQGRVRLEGRAAADAGGPFNPLGATLFWGAWGYKYDRARLERNLAVLSDAGVDYVRVLGSVGGSSWNDRQTDPRWDDYDAVIAGLTDLAYDKYGMRVQWTIFGGAPFTPPGGARRALVNRFVKLARGREHKIFAFEIANEASNNGFEGRTGVAELRRLGKQLSDRTTVLVALTAPPRRSACEVYAGAAADVMTVHYDRAFDTEGPIRPVLQPWSFPASYHSECRGQLPRGVFNNEPIGPESSVRQDDDPSRLAAAFVMTFLAGNASYVFHAGPGIRGGGEADRSGPIPRHANFDELPHFGSIAAALGAARKYLPPGLANWHRLGPGDSKAPVHGFQGTYTASHGSEFVALVAGIDRRATVRMRVAASVEVRKASTGELAKEFRASPGEKVALDGDESLILIGRVRE